MTPPLTTMRFFTASGTCATSSAPSTRMLSPTRGDCVVMLTVPWLMVWVIVTRSTLIGRSMVWLPSPSLTCATSWNGVPAAGVVNVLSRTASYSLLAPLRCAVFVPRPGTSIVTVSGSEDDANTRSVTGKVTPAGQAASCSGEIHAATGAFGLCWPR